MRNALRRRLGVLVALAGLPALVAAGEGAIGLLAPQPAAKLGAEGQAAWALAAKEHKAALVVVAAPGKFTDDKGQDLPLSRFAVLWLHQGDGVEQEPPVYDPKTLDALRRFVEDGGGLYLSGAALNMVHWLRIEPINPRLGGPGNDSNPAGFIAVETRHPVFRGLPDGPVPLSDKGYPAFSDFHGAGGPSRGMLLARSPGGSENPFAEYELGKGRIIVMGWRLPHYAHAQNPHRANLERLTANILAYLATPKSWEKVVVKPLPKPAAPPPAQAYVAAGISEKAVESLELAINDLIATFGERYPKGPQFLKRLGDLEAALKAADAKTPKETREKLDRDFLSLQREALLANPLLDFDRILLVKRGEKSPRLGLVQNWESNSSLPHTGYDDEIAVLTLDRSGRPPEGGTPNEGKLSTLFRPEGGRFVGDVDLHWDADRLLFSMPGKNGRWQISEINADGTGLRELPLITQPDVDNYDACYLPDGRILFTSTACFTGVPCVTGSSHVSNIYLFDPNLPQVPQPAGGSGETQVPQPAGGYGAIRRLTFEQDHDWCPTVLNNGRVLYLRWEYSDIPHYVSRILFHMNPDGTEQMEFYGSNSYWPNANFYARPCPNHPTRFVGIVGGHHDSPRMGELVLFDVAQGRREADGVVQRIPGRGKPVEPKILDGLVGGSWPKFLHPWPLSDKYILTACQPNGGSRWGIYLVDVFDNLLLLKEEPFYALLEPIPLAKRPKPPIIPDKVDLKRKDAVVYMSDVYAGGGLKDVPRGTVKKLRLFTYQFAYHGMGGQVNRVGLDGPWDVKRIIGTVPVEPDGSAYFRLPANVPVSVQPLDGEGKALQLMRSWMVAMPGETLSCVGCHETQNSSPPNRHAQAFVKPPADITPWYGPTRGFSFKREVQPVLDYHCTGCHDGSNPPLANGQTIPNYAAKEEVHPQARDKGYNGGTKFSASYLALRSFVRGHTIESDIHLLNPAEFHADTTYLVQKLKKGHYGVALDAEAWDRLITWIDLNTPYHGTWHEIIGMNRVQDQRDRRRAMDALYAGLDEDPEAIYDVTYKPPDTFVPRTASPPTSRGSQGPREVTAEGWPFDAAEAKKRQAALGPVEQSLELGEGIKLDLVRIPAGEFLMGDAAGAADERPVTRVRIDKPFWMAKFETTNEQFALFDPRHDSRLETGDFLQFSVQERGYPTNGPRQPVCRVNWHQATAFCKWLSDRTGLAFALPTEAQWEWACRAGTSTPLYYGSVETDFAKLANLADHTLRFVDTFGWGLPSGAVPPWRPAIESVKDGFRVSAPVGAFEPNPWGLHDMAGNVWEWTSSAYRPCPPDKSDKSDVSAPSDAASAATRFAVRGGSWYCRPQQARSAYRLSYPAWQRVYDVGFRVVCADAPRQAKR
ncbi:MAG TPA: SUMF1/EgtB/PvdO family nonheme iron enzyme [Planctomycetota bacterium]|nr:SUMF1/EgtB/PvdO family nonheme iron enzyme [Planctomycetota bacterium]HRR81773.1 SUMF1/EgtB/PvdO family nonheme iron enzyme [Planctomycetota bacterium]HRT95338.1 SUMF1/EgtB/PvdO family nonheme iron enzyme [Planctomycetota bacterium]